MILDLGPRPQFYLGFFAVIVPQHHSAEWFLLPKSISHLASLEPKIQGGKTYFVFSATPK